MRKKFKGGDDLNNLFCNLEHNFAAEKNNPKIKEAHLSAEYLCDWPIIGWFKCDAKTISRMQCRALQNPDYLHQVKLLEKMITVDDLIKELNESLVNEQDNNILHKIQNFERQCNLFARMSDVVAKADTPMTQEMHDAIAKCRNAAADVRKKNNTIVRLIPMEFD